MDPLTIIAMINAGVKVVELARDFRAQSKQTTEWTPEQDQEFDAAMERAFKQDHWSLDPK
jgi:hypothetical protein